jgi:TPR repeat protein
MSESKKQTALVPVQSAALTKPEVKSLIARGRTDLRIREEAEEWLKRGLEFLRQAQIQDMCDDAESFYEDEPPCDPSFSANPNDRRKCAFTCFERGINLDPNHAELQFWLGNLYTNGQGVPQDYVLAASWWRKAAEQGFTKAQHNLGCAYEFGQGVERDHTQAAIWWNKAAEQGYAYAQNDLGYAYERGWGVPQNGEQAAFWYRKAAEQGLPEGQFHIGIFYSCGDVVELDQAQAAQWYRKAGVCPGSI